VLANLTVWIFTEISWLWWNVIGLLATVVGSAAISAHNPLRPTTVVLKTGNGNTSEKRRLIHLLIGADFILIILVCWWLEHNLSLREVADLGN
jgi:hypothetical protein